MNCLPIFSILTVGRLNSREMKKSSRLKLEVHKTNPYNPDFIAKIKESRKQIRVGKTVKIELDNIYKD